MGVNDLMVIISQNLCPVFSFVAFPSVHSVTGVKDKQGGEMFKTS